MAESRSSDNGRQLSVLGPTLKFKGELTADEDLLIQGNIEGTIKHTSYLTIGEAGRLKADVEAELISVEGRVEGHLAGSKSVAVLQSADVVGNIVSPTVSLHEGAKFNGQIDMSQGATVSNLSGNKKKASDPKKDFKTLSKPADEQGEKSAKDEKTSSRSE